MGLRNEAGTADSAGQRPAPLSGVEVTGKAVAVDGEDGGLKWVVVDRSVEDIPATGGFQSMEHYRERQADIEVEENGGKFAAEDAVAQLLDRVGRDPQAAGVR